MYFAQILLENKIISHIVQEIMNYFHTFSINWHI